MAAKHCFALPPFCHFTPEEWRTKGHEYDEIRDNMLGWDITDYGQNDFDRIGFSLITIRKGNLKMREKYTKTYAEKLPYLKEGQYSPMHFHWSKMEDIINRGGGNVLIRVCNKSLTVTPGQTLTVDWLNDPVEAGSGRIQINKTAAADAPEQNITAGAPLAGAVYTVSDATTGKVLGTMETGSDGTAQTADLPIGRYLVAETKAPQGFRLDSTPMVAEITVSGEVVQLTQEDWPLSLGVSIRKSGSQEIQPGQMLTYTLSGIANLSDTDLSQFYWRDTLPAGLELLQITTGTYSVSLRYRVEYRTNRRDYQVLADGFDSSENHAFAMSTADLGLANGEYVTEVRLAFGTVPAGFCSVENPILQVQVPADLSGGSMIRNTADVGGRCGDAWLTETASWDAAVRVLDEEQPKTGF